MLINADVADVVHGRSGGIRTNSDVPIATLSLCGNFLAADVALETHLE